MDTIRKFIQIVESQFDEDPIEQGLNKLRDDAANLGVMRNRRALDLEWINRTTGDKGAGAKVIKALCDFADANGMRIYTPVLMDYYRQFSFEIDPKGNDEAMMRRLPIRSRKRVVKS